MTIQLILHPQVLDDNGVPVVATDNIEIFESGTTTPLDVFSDSARTVNLGSTLSTLGGGRISTNPVFIAEGKAAKVIYKNDDNTVLDTIDPCPSARVATSAASQIGFTPITGNAADNVQSAIENNTSGIATASVLTRVHPASNSGNDYTVALDPNVTERGHINFIIRINADATGPVSLNYGAGLFPVYIYEDETLERVSGAKHWQAGSEAMIYDDGTTLRLGNYRANVFDPDSPEPYTDVRADASGNLPAINGLALTGIATQLFHVRDEKASGTEGGAGIDTVTRDLNTVVTNEISGASLASNQITLPAGTYFVEGYAPFFIAGNIARDHRALLWNVTDNAQLVFGPQRRLNMEANIGASSGALVTGRFTIADTKTLEFRHEVGAAAANNLGRPQAGASPEVYSELLIWKVS